MLKDGRYYFEQRDMSVDYKYARYGKCCVYSGTRNNRERYGTTINHAEDVMETILKAEGEELLFFFDLQTTAGYPNSQMNPGEFEFDLVWGRSPFSPRTRHWHSVLCPTFVVNAFAELIGPHPRQMDAPCNPFSPLLRLRKPKMNSNFAGVFAGTRVQVGVDEETGQHVFGLIGTDGRWETFLQLSEDDVWKRASDFKAMVLAEAEAHLQREEIHRMLTYWPLMG
ncbi:MAG: hypothetical protein ACM3NH_00950 [Candidatus Saccharibacteria bacterium]